MHQNLRDNLRLLNTGNCWAARSPYHDATLRISGVALLRSFQTMLDRERVKGIDAEIGSRFGDDVYRGHLTPGRLAISQGDPDNARLIFIGSPMALGAAVHGGVPIWKLVKSGALAIVGDCKLAQRRTTLFRLPEKLVNV
jgi:hypothetical protein